MTRRRTTRTAAALALVSLLAAAAPALAQSAVEAAREHFARYHEDLGRLDRARDLLQEAAEREPTPEVLAALARAWFLIGEFRARTEADKLAAYERGREAGRPRVQPWSRGGVERPETGPRAAMP